MQVSVWTLFPYCWKKNSIRYIEASSRTTTDDKLSDNICDMDTISIYSPANDAFCFTFTTPTLRAVVSVCLCDTSLWVW